MNRSTSNLQSKWVCNSNTTQSSTKEGKDEDVNSSNPQHHLPSAVPPRTLQHRFMPSRHRIARNLTAAEEIDRDLSEVPATASDSIEKIPHIKLQRCAEQINDLVQKPCPGAKSTPSRALNILRYVAGGGDFFPDVSHPEIEALNEIPQEKWLALLKPLGNVLKHHLSRKQGIRMSNAFEYLSAAGTSEKDKNLIESRRRRFQMILGELIKTLIRDSAPDAALSLALEARAMITTSTDLEENGTARAIKLIYCAAGGSIYVNSKQPETRDLAKRLLELSDTLRPHYLQFVYGKLAAYLTVAQRTIIGECLARFTELIRGGQNDFEYSDFATLRAVVKEELEKLNVKIPTYN